MPPELVSRYVLQICIKYEKLISALVIRNGLSCTFENSWASFILSGGECVVELVVFWLNQCFSKNNIWH